MRYHVSMIEDCSVRKMWTNFQMGQQNEDNFFNGQQKKLNRPV